MSFGEFYTAFSGLGDAFKEGADKAEAARLLDQQLTAALGVQQGQQAQVAPANALAALGQAQPAAPRTPTFATSGGSLGSYLDTVRGKESGGNDFAKNPSSSATGRYQFTEGTWNGLARKYPQLGLTAGGRNDPAQQERAMQAFTKDNSDALSRAGVPITPGNLYVSHFLGEAGGPRFIAGALSNPDAPATQFVTPGAAAANRTIFFNRDGTPKRAGEVYAERTSRFGGGEAPVPTRVASAGDATAMPPMGMPQMGAPQGAPRVMPQQVAQAGDNPADLPVPNAQPVGFQIPGEAPQSDFVPGTVASPAIQQPGAQGGGMGLAPAAAQRLSPDQVTNLRAMLRNPNTQGYAAKIIEGLNKPSEFSFQVVGDQLIRTSKDGRAEVVPNITKPPTFSTVKGSDGNDYILNPQTGALTRAIEGRDKQFKDLITPEERAAAGVPTNYAGAVQRGPDGELKFPGKASTEVNIDQKGESAFATTANTAIAKRFEKLSEEGDAARTDSALLGQLRGLGTVIGTGPMAAAQSYLADKGIKLGDNVGAVEAYDAIIDKMVPAQRIPGSGTTSDFDAKGFKSALPNLMKTPEGNALIINTLDALNTDKMARARIAERALTGEIKPQEAVQQLRALPPPNIVFKSGLADLAKAGKLSGGGSVDPSAAPQSAPPQAQLKPLPADTLTEARDAIRRGAPAAKVIERLRSQGYDAAGL